MTNRAPIARVRGREILRPAAFGTANPGLLELARLMPERGRGGLDEKVREHLAEHKALLGYHTWISVKSPQGFPDWVFCGPGGVMYRELKRQDKNPTPRQREWLDALTAAGQDAGVWRPSDLMDGTVARELAALAGLRVAGGDR